MPSATWDWLLCDGNGKALAELTTGSGKQITRKRNYYTECQCVLSHDDGSAQALLDAVEKGPWPTMRAYRRGAGSTNVLRFNGWLAPFTEELEESGSITAVFRSPFWRLYGDGSTTGRFTEALTAEEKIADEIAASLVRLAGCGFAEKGAVADTSFNETSYVNSFGVGLGIGTLASTVARFVSYKYANIGQAIVYLSQMLEGFDFSETFIEGGVSDGRGTPLLALFNTFAKLGSVRTATFQYGPATLANVSKVERSTAPPENAIRLLGGSGAVSDFSVSESVAGVLASVEKLGSWPSQQSASGQPTLEALEKRAVALLRTSAVRTYTLFPDFSVANCPQPYDDFDIGDTVGFYGSKNAFHANLNVRVNEMDLMIDDEGNETTSMPNPQSLVPGDETDLLHTNFTVETGNAN